MLQSWFIFRVMFSVRGDTIRLIRGEQQDTSSQTSTYRTCVLDISNWLNHFHLNQFLYMYSVYEKCSAGHFTEPACTRLPQTFPVRWKLFRFALFKDNLLFPSQLEFSPEFHNQKGNKTNKKC